MDKLYKIKKLNILLVFIGVLSLLLVLCLKMPCVLTYAEDINYIYFDLRAGNVTIDNSKYQGYIYQTDGSTTIKKTITGSHNGNNQYYVYQSTSYNQSTTGLVNGEMIIPNYEPITVGDLLWKDYITNNTDILGIIDEWNAQTLGKRESTSNQILITEYGSKCNMTIDNIWSTKQTRGSMSGGSISITNAKYSGTHVLLLLKGDNRLGSLRYQTGGLEAGLSSLTISSYMGNNSTEGSLTVIGSQKLITNNGNYTDVKGDDNNVAANHWDSVIGGTDGEQEVKSLYIKGGTIYAGSTPRENSTAIGGGGNGEGQVTIDGGNVTAVAHTTGTAIGGGIAHTGSGGTSNVVINNGKVYAYNFGQPAHDVIASYGTTDSNVIEAASHIAGTAIGGASSILQAGNSKIAYVTINGGYVYAESLGGCGIGGGNSVKTTAGSAEVKITGGTVIAKSRGQENYTFADGKKINIKAGVSIGGGTGGITGNGGYANIIISGGNITTGSIGGGSTTNTNGKIGYANINISGGDISGQFIMVKGASQACVFKMTDGLIHNSDTSDTTYVRLQANGGAVYMDDPSGTAMITGGNIKDCKAENGGAIYMTAGTFTLDGTGIIENCRADNLGGAIYLGKTSSTKGTVYIKNGSINNNSALNGNGGAFYLDGGDAYISGGSLSNNKSLNGGGAYLAGGMLNITGGNIYANTATNGAGAYLAGGTLYALGGSIDSNTATNGGGAYLQGGTLNVDGCSISNNTAENGGGAYVNLGNIDMSTGSFVNNTASNDGGGVYLTGGNLTVIGGSFTNNKAANNGGGSYIVGGDFYLDGKDAIFTNNSAKNGGGVYLTGGKPNLYEGTITENTALNCGGGIYIDKQLVNLEPKNAVKITKNKAGYLPDGTESSFDGFGGAIYISGTENTDDACFKVNKDSTGTVLIDQNIAKTNGGGVCINNGYFTMDGTNVTVTNNQALSGGGVAVMAGDFNISNGSIGEEFNPNIATNGGGVYVSGGNVLITNNGSIKHNKASINGGGVFIANGNFTMIGGTVGNNIAEAGNGGGLYVSANLKNVIVEILSGLFQNNIASLSGGALAVVGNEGGTEDITVTIGANKNHYDEDKNFVSCDHGKNGISAFTCPVIEFNTSGKSGGAIYITGGKSTYFNMYCLEEDHNGVTEDDSRSNFMMVEGGTVVVSTLEHVTHGDELYGSSIINNSIHVTAGIMDLYGSMNNPLIDAPITVDITSNDDHFADHRISKGDYYKLQYFENFKGSDGTVTGQYTIYQIEHNTYHTISGVIYNHPGYEIIGWYTNDDGTGDKYGVGEKYLFNGNPGDLTIYAIWQAHSYYVQFDPNIPSGIAYTGSMEKVQYNYNTSYTLPANQYVYKGYIFSGWLGSDGKTYVECQVVINLTEEDGETIILYAIWTKCDHLDDDYYIYDAIENVLYKKCKCMDHTITATVQNVSTVYDANPHKTDVIYGPDDDPLANLGLEITYMKDGLNVGVPINAGTYTASITLNGATAVGTVFIDKAIQDVPSKPTYQVSSDATGTLNVITVQETVAPIGKAYEYHIEWYDGGILKTENPEWKSSNVFSLNTAFTNYYVYIRYAENENYYASEGVRADFVYYFTGTVEIIVDCPKEIDFIITEMADKGGMIINVFAKTGYFLTSDFSVTCTDNSDITDAVITEQTVRETYTLTSIPSSGRVIVTIDGFKANPEILGFVTENEVFNNFTDTSANISKDSAFTVLFKLNSVSDYEEYVLNFSSELPVGTSIIFIDEKTNTYKFINLQETKKQVPISSMSDLFDDVDQTIESEQEFRFIINFQNTETGFNLDSLTVWLTSSKVNVDDECVIDLPKTTVDTSLSDVESKLEIVTDETTLPSGLEKHIEYSYADSLGENSKYLNRKAVLWLIPIAESNLPIDARLNVVIGADRITIYKNVEGKFVIPLDVNYNDIYITLESDMFVDARSQFEFDVKLISSNSQSSLASVNGTVLKEIKLAFTKEETKVPSLKLTLSKDSYVVGETACVNVDFENIPEGHTVTLTLMLRDDNYRYNSTGWSTGITTKGKIDVPLAGQSAGSYCFSCVVKDQSGMTVLTVTYYFIIYN